MDHRPTDKVAVVNRLALDDDWSHPTNRAIARIARSLLASGVDHEVIYDAILAAGEPIRVSP